MTGFETAMKFTGLAEGGYTKLPGDKGGETNYGISDLRDGVLDGYVTLSGGSKVRVKDLTHAQALTVYQEEYWLPIGGDKLPVSVAVAVFDFGVNSGVSRAVKALQRACGVAQDGVIGPFTLSKANSLGAHSLAAAICDIRIEFLKASNDPTVVKYRDSLIARAVRCKAYTQTL